MPEDMVFTNHALERMFARGVTTQEVREAVIADDVVERRPVAGRPYAVRLLLGRSRAGPIHVVVADDDVRARAIVVTVYRPDPERWAPSFRERRR